MKHLTEQQAGRKLRRQEWYHQRFDGSPLYLFFIGEAEVKKEKRKPKGTEADIRVCFFQEGKADWYLSQRDIKRGAEVLLRLAKRQPLLSKKLLKAWQKDEEAFQKFFDDFLSLNLRRFSDEELEKLFKQYFKLAISRFTSSAIIDHFALGTDELLAQLIRKEIGGGIKKESDFTKIFSVLTSPVYQSFINEAEIHLLKIADKAHKKGLAFVADDIQHYQRQYFWIKNNYITARRLTVNHFQKEIEVLLKEGWDIKQRYRQLRDTPRLNRAKKQKMLRRYHFSPFVRTLLLISEDFTWWQDERKKATYLNIHIGTRLVGEMARRRGVPAELTKYLVPQEVGGWWRNGIPSISQLQKRKQACGVVCSRQGYYITAGRSATERLRSLLFPSQKKDTKGDLRGLAASVGRVVGQVKVVHSVKEVAKVKKGDILVAVMTRPDYIAAMRKAAAIVTNEGGLTCHAAIVSRELGIPCVIGTRIATHVLNDGDVVEVNANHGVVRVIGKG